MTPTPKFSRGSYPLCNSSERRKETLRLALQRNAPLALSWVSSIHISINLLRVAINTAGAAGRRFNMQN
ncbi:hypothetical protein BYT27DRAFT_7205834 [Phlegmacium glaucopus]|nr:hypothetical protein BYT27DRAFT_7205834 [Phlegmacium glaucopus]